MSGQSPTAARTDFRSVFSSASSAFLLLAPDAPRFTILDVNDAYLRATLRERDDLIGQGVFEAFPDNPDDPSAASVANLRASFERVLASKRADGMTDLKYDIPHPDGGFEERWWSPVNTPVLDERGEVSEIIHHASDVTDLRRSEEARRASEARYRQIVEGAEDFAMIALDERGTITAWNSGAERLLGYDADEAIGRPGAIFFSPEDREAGIPEHEMNRAQSEGKALNERWHQRQDGTRFWGSGLMMRLDEGDSGYLKFFRDRTAEHEAELRARESGERFRNMADNAPVMMWVTEADGRCIYLNQRWYEFTGQTPEEAEGFGWLDAAHPDDKDDAERIFLKSNARHAPFRVEYRLRRADGVYRWAIDAASPRFDAHGSFLGHVGSVIDIDERREAEDALAETEERLRLAVDNAEIGFWDVDEVNDELIWPPRTKAMFGISAHAPVSMVDFYAGLHPEDRAATGAAYEAAADPARRALYDVEYRTIGKEDGVVRWVAAKGRGVFDKAGRCLRVAGTAIDITARKIAEAALRESEEFNRGVLQSSADCIKVLGLDARLEFMSDGGMCVMEVDDFKAVEGAYWPDLWTADERPKVFAAVEEAKQGRTGRFQGYATTMKGSPRWWDVVVTPIKGADGAPEKLLSISRDITIEKLSEERLRESEARLRFLGRLDEALRNSVDAEGAILAAATLLGEQLNASRCAYSVVDADSNGFIIRGDYNAPGVASSTGRYSLDLFGSRAATDLRAGRTLVIHDVGKDFAPGEGREMFQAIDIYAVVCCPLIRDDRLTVMMAVHQDRPREWQADEIALVETVSERCWAHVERVAAEARLRESEERYRTLFTSIEAGFCVAEVDLHAPGGRIDYRVVEANPAFYRQTGFPEAILCKWLREAAPDLEDYWYETYGRVARTGEPVRFEQGSDALGRWFDVYAFRVGEAEERRVAILFNDISARRNAEEQLRELNDTLEQRVEERTGELERAHEQLRQSQKLEAMGLLTGGVAHDFNNLLTPIIGSLDLLERRGVGSEREQRLIAGAMKAAERATTLVQRLLAFARRQPLQAIAVDLGRLVENMADLVSSTTGPQIKVSVEVAEGLPAAIADPNQIEMALLNLAVNARDAMPDGGTLRISAAAERVAAGEHADLKAGDYVKLSVADTGVGMDEAVLKRSVEPFFSTKGIGKGTGLGLSMVHGLASQLGGTLSIQSRRGVGTNVELWLPVSAAPAEIAEGTADAPQPLGEAGTALLVDDEALVRMSTADMLADLGYEVVEAESAEQALALVRGGLTPSVLVTDHLMPGMTGTDLARALRAEQAALQVLIVSGYAESEGIAPDLPRLTKPFRKAELAASLAEAGAGVG